MKSWRAERFGHPQDVLELQEVEIPNPPDNGVTVRVIAAGVGLPDLLMVQGLYPLVPKPPVSPGQEMVGEVVAVGPQSGFKVGNRVMGMSHYDKGHGAFSEYCPMDDHRGCLAPDALSDEEAAGFMIPFNTAYASLVTRGALKSGDVLLVLGAAGSSGGAAIQVGKVLGATIIAVASSEEKLEFCSKMGADHLVNYKTGNICERLSELTAGRGVDVVFDPVGGDISEQIAPCIAKYGRVLLVGFASGRWPQFDPLHMVLNNYSVCGVFARGLSDSEDARPATHGLYSKDRQEVLRALQDLAEKQIIRTPVSQVFALEDTTKALALLQSTNSPGRIIIRIS